MELTLMVDFKGFTLQTWYFPKSWPKGNPLKKNKKKTPHPDSSYCCWSRTLKSRSELKKETGIIRRGRKSENDTCLWADVVLGLCGGLRRVAEGVCVDRGTANGSLGCSRLELRNSGVVPSGCLIQVAANTQQVWTYLHMWRHGNLMDRKHEAL